MSTLENLTYTPKGEDEDEELLAKLASELGEIDLNKKEPETQVIDIQEQIKFRNFAPLLYLMSKNLLSNPQSLDPHGYNPLHNACAFNNVEAIRQLIEVFSFDIDGRSSAEQTPLMLAC